MRFSDYWSINAKPKTILQPSNPSQDTHPLVCYFSIPLSQPPLGICGIWEKNFKKAIFETLSLLKIIYKFRSTGHAIPGISYVRVTRIHFFYLKEPSKICPESIFYFFLAISVENHILFWFTPCWRTPSKEQKICSRWLFPCYSSILLHSQVSLLRSTFGIEKISPWFSRLGSMCSISWISGCICL